MVKSTKLKLPNFSLLLECNCQQKCCPHNYNLHSLTALLYRLPHVLQLTVLLNTTTATNYHSLELWNTSQNTAQPRIKFVRSLPVPANYCTQHMHTHSHCVHPAHSVSPRCSARTLPLWKCAPVNLMISHHTTHRSAQTQKACNVRIAPPHPRSHVHTHTPTHLHSLTHLWLEFPKQLTVLNLVVTSTGSSYSNICMHTRE